ncbi:MAG: FG-GAP-like repeat-containing protein [Dysgonamonadaceae bacterium]|jgi:hypothetical protein|nr:FG-GAP-like repeat-containing protein [Dysgonamonadaceae bacterium]
MKKNYFYKAALVALVACWGLTSVFAQVKIPNFTEMTDLVVGDDGETREPFTFSYEAAAAWGDYNNDGYLDLVTIGAGHNNVLTTILYKNHGGQYFTKEEHPFPTLTGAAAVWLDYNNDGNLDLFIAGQNDDGKYSGLFKNKGAAEGFDFAEDFIGEFAYLNHEGGNRANRFVAAGDYNNDGYVDLYMQGWDNEAPKGRAAYLYRNLWGTGWQKIDLPVNGDQPLLQWNSGAAQWGDYDNDGFLDLICSGYGLNSDEYIEVYGSGFDYEQNAGAYYKNNGDGTFAIPKYFAAGETNMEWIDYDNDGKLDIAASGYAWYKDTGWQGDLFHNEGDDSFLRLDGSKTGLRQAQSTSLAIGDVNNDGFEDVLYLIGNDPNGESDGVYLNKLADPAFLNNDTDSIFVKVDLPYGIGQRGGSACLVDFDNDGDLDAFLIAYGDVSDHFARFVRNDLSQEIPVNQAPSVPTNLQATTNADGSTTFTWDASTDDLTPAVALRYNLYVKQDDEIKMVLPADLSTGRLKVNEGLAAISTTHYQFFGLSGEYVWGVQAIDNAKNASAFATSGATGLAKVNPANIQVSGGSRSIKVTADASAEGTVTIYSISGAELYANAGQISTTIAVPAGVYAVKIVSGTDTIVEKIIVK